METIKLEAENKTSETLEKETFHYYDINGDPIFKTKEIFKQESKFIFYPYSVDNSDGSVRTKRIGTIELIGWSNLDKIPEDFKTTGKYGFGSQRIKQLMTVLYSKFKSLEKIRVGINIQNRFTEKSISVNWSDLEPLLRKINREKIWYDKNKRILINNGLSDITTKVSAVSRTLSSGELDSFLKRFDSFGKVSKGDIDSLALVLETIPPSKISTTSNFIKTRDRINKVYIEDIIKEFEKLMTIKVDNEKQWQSFFGKNTWIMTHLFPYEVILKQQEAYVGGKSIENKDGRVVDFLFENGFEDNFALLEIKTHKKELLKNNPYRKPDVFAVSDDLSGGLNQCLDQKDTFLRDFGQKYQSLDPKSILIIGQKSELSKHQKKCFELLRSNQKNVDIVTFDELLAKLKGLLAVMTDK